MTHSLPKAFWYICDTVIKTVTNTVSRIQIWFFDNTPLFIY